MMNSVKASKTTYSSQPSYTHPLPPLSQPYTHPPSPLSQPYTHPPPPSSQPCTYSPSPSSQPYMYPQLTSTYPPLLNNDSQSTVKVVPELKEFLKELDAAYGEGKYTQYLEIFENNDIRVNLISRISDDWWENKLHITSLGHILTLK